MDTTPPDWAQITKDFYSINGVLWPASMNPNSLLLYYNKDHFTEAGLDAEAPPQTLAEVAEAAKTLKEAGGIGDTIRF